MNLGIVADEIHRDFGKAVAIAKPLGIRRFEIRNLTTGRVPLCDPEEIREVERIAQREQVEITAISPGLFKLTHDPAVFARVMREVYPQAAELAYRWHLPGLIVFGFHKPGATESNAASLPPAAIPSAAVAWMAEAAERAAADGLLLIIEPEPICWADTASAAVDLIRRTHSRSLRINLDPGNVAWFTNRGPIGEFECAAPYISNVHIKDYCPGPRWLPAGEGIVDYRAHFEALRRIGYTGPVSLEPHMDGSSETIRRCKEAVESLTASL